MDADIDRRDYRRKPHGSHWLFEHGASVSRNRLASCISDRGYAATWDSDAGNGNRRIFGRKDDECSRRFRALASHHGPVRGNSTGNHDHPNSGTGCIDVADRIVSMRGNGYSTTYGDDGCCHGGFCELHEPYLTPG